MALQSNRKNRKRRHAHAVPLARRRLLPLLHKVRWKPAESWPAHLKAAQKLLSGTPGLTDRQIREILVDSIRAAHKCAQAIDHKSREVMRNHIRIKLLKALKRLANCTKRAPSALRKCLNEELVSKIRHRHVDLELIDEIFDAAVIAFSKFPETEAAKTALGIMCGKSSTDKPLVLIKEDYSALRSIDQRNAEKAIAKLARMRNAKIAASDIFNALASAIHPGQFKQGSSEIHTLIVSYVAKVANIWRKHGVRPSRASHQMDSTYTRKFHHFVDLVLT